MAKHIIENAQVTLNSVLLSSWVQSVEFLVGKETRSFTAMGDTWEQKGIRHIRRFSARLNFFQDYDTSAFYHTLKSLLDSTAGQTLVVRPTTAIRSTTNPEWSGSVGINSDFSFLNAAVGEPNSGSITLDGIGTLSTFTSST